MSGLENRDYGRRDPSRPPRGTLHLQKLALTSLTCGGRLVGIVRSRIQATEFSFFNATDTLKFVQKVRLLGLNRAFNVSPFT
jgi:hypothetical protein